MKLSMLHIEGVYSGTNENVDKSFSIYLLNEIRINRLRRKLSISLWCLLEFFPVHLTVCCWSKTYVIQVGIGTVLELCSTQG
jgi:hypothetical protein